MCQLLLFGWQSIEPRDCWAETRDELGRRFIPAVCPTTPGFNASSTKTLACAKPPVESFLGAAGVVRWKSYLLDLECLQFKFIMDHCGQIDLTGTCCKCTVMYNGVLIKQPKLISWQLLVFLFGSSVRDLLRMRPRDVCMV